MKSSRCYVALALILGFSDGQDVHGKNLTPREWTAADGSSKILATLHAVSESNQQAVLEVADRGLRVVNWNTLSQSDQEYLRNHKDGESKSRPEEESPPAPEARTTSDPAIPVDQLRLLVKPLSMDETKVEVDAWFELLRAKALQVSASQVGVKKTNEAMDLADESTDAAADAIVDAAEIKQQADDEAEDTESQLTEVDNQAGQETTTAGQVETATDEEEIVEQATEKKDELLDDVNELLTQQTAISDRLKVVLDSYEAKGGDATDARSYLAAIGGIEVDVTDASATWSAVTGWLASDEGGYRWAKNLALFLTTILVSWLLSLFISSIVRRIINRTSNISVMARSVVVNAVRRCVLAVGVLIGLAMLEINIGPLLAALGATGFIVGFALQGTLSNFASGLMILVYRPFDTGDLVEAGGVMGRIDEMNLVSTTFLTLDNQKIIVPNNSIWGSVIRNVTANDIRRVDMTFGIGYEDDIQLAQSTLCEIIEQNDMILQDPAPLVKLHELGDSSVNFICRPWTLTSNYWDVYWDVTRAVKERFDEVGISIPFPQQDVHVHQVTSRKTRKRNFKKPSPYHRSAHRWRTQAYIRH